MPVMVRFRAGDGAWLAPVDRVLGVRTAHDIRPVPDPSPDVIGVIDRDGTTLPVCRSLGDGGAYVLIVGASDGAVGVLTDVVRDVAEVDADSLRPRPTGQRRPFVEATHGAGADLAFVLDAAELVRSVTTCREPDHD